MPPWTAREPPSLGALQAMGSGDRDSLVPDRAEVPRVAMQQRLEWPLRSCGVQRIDGRGMADGDVQGRQCGWLKDRFGSPGAILVADGGRVAGWIYPLSAK